MPEKEPTKKEEEKIVCNANIQFGTYAWAFIGTFVACYVRDHIKHNESPSIEA